MATFSTVAAITGNGSVFAVNAQGVSRLLKVGDALEKGETIRTVGDVRVELLMEDGHMMSVAPQQTVRLDENVTESDQRPSAQDSALTAPAATADTVIDALNRGGDLNAQLDATAAGIAAGGGENGGSSFVQLLRITEGVEPLAYNYDYTAPTITPELQAVATTLTSTLELTADPAVLEGSPGVNYTVTLGDPTSSDMTVTLSNGAVIVIPAGSTTGSVLVPVQGDDVYKDGETLQATVSTVQGGSFSSLTVSDANVITVVSDTIDTTPISVSVSVVDGAGDVNNVIEGNQLTFRFSVNQAPQIDLTLNVTVGGVAQTVTIAAGQLFTDVTVNTRADENYLQGATTVTGTVNSVSPTADGNFENLSIVGATATATVVDDGDATTIGIDGATSVEEGSVASYVLSLSAPGQTDVVVKLAYSGVAVDGSDYTGVASVTIPAGSLSASFNLATINDTLLEGSEVFNVQIVSATGGNFESLQVSSTASNVNTTITDGDTLAFHISQSTATIAEGVSDTYTVSYNGGTLATGEVAKVDIKLSDISTDSSDYSNFVTAVTTAATAAGVGVASTTGGLTLTFTGGASAASFDFALTATDDTLVESSEQFKIELSNANSTTGVAVSIVDASVTTTITDNDLPPPVTYGEGAAWQMNPITAFGGYDIRPKDGNITLLAGRTIHWDVLVKGDTGGGLTLTHDALPAGSSAYVQKLYAENGDTLFRFYLTATTSDVVMSQNANGQFEIQVSGATSVTGVQIINSDEFVLPHSNYPDNYATSFDTGGASSGADRDWLSPDTNGGELAVASPMPQTGKTVDYQGDNDMSYGTTGDDSLTGGSGNDFIDGRAGSDMLFGGDGNDILMGGLGNDKLVGGAGQDTLFGGQGNDELTGGSGGVDTTTDTFRWSLGDQGVVGAPNADVIKDFNLNLTALNGGDVLDLKDLLVGERDGSGVDLSNLTQFLHFSEVGGKAVLSIDHDGGTATPAATADQTITFDNLTLAQLQSYAGGTSDSDIIAKLLADGHLKTDA